MDRPAACRLSRSGIAKTIFSNNLPETLADDLRQPGDVMESFNILSRPISDELRNIEMLVPVAVDGHMRYVIALCPGLGRRTLLSGEVQFLRTVARQLGVRVHHLEGEAAARQQALRESLLRNQLTEAELRALRAQVNPHFFFNSLNTIADLIVTNPTNAERMTLRLASIFRHVLAQTDRQFMSLHEEFDFMRNYLQIEQERFGPRLTVNMSLDPSIAHENIPTLLLQPLVENALKHGLAPKPQRRKVGHTMIHYDPTIKFVEHFGMYQAPDTLADAVEQYRIDALRTAMQRLHVGTEIFELLVTEDNSLTGHFGTLCDPIGYFADSSLNYLKPKTSAILPSVPSTLADLGVGGPALWIIPPISKALKQADGPSIAKIAALDHYED